MTWLHKQLGAAVRGSAGTPGWFAALPWTKAKARAGLDEAVSTLFAGDKLIEGLPYLLSFKGMSRKVTYRGTRYEVSVRLALSDARPTPWLDSDSPDGHPKQTEGRNKAVVETHDSGSSGNYLPFELPYAHAVPVGDTNSVTLQGSVEMAHNQIASSVSVQESYTAMTAMLFANEPLLPFDYGTQWQFKVTPVDGTGQAPAPDAPATPAPPSLLPGPLGNPAGQEIELVERGQPDDGWGRETTGPGRLAALFPRYLARDAHIPGYGTSSDPTGPRRRSHPPTRFRT
ncbi:hypothetical protein NKH18_45215 [Streptomyces sp. M10(2022)]